MTACSLATAAGVVVAYLVGSISTGLLVARARGVDLRTTGSGNVGATNVSRALGRRTGVLVFVGDAVKGFLPVLIGRLTLPPRDARADVLAILALSPIVGHIWPLWHRFRGGKGVATAAGAFLALTPIASVIAGALWVALFLATRIVSLASLLAAAALPIAIALGGAPLPFLVAALAALGLVLLRHRGNVARLLHHEESRFRR